MNERRVIVFRRIVGLGVAVILGFSVESVAGGGTGPSPSDASDFALGGDVGLFAASSVEAETESGAEAGLAVGSADSTGGRDTGGIAPPVPSTYTPRFTRLWRSPTGALFKSIVVPGGGQWSNGKWQKALIFTSIEGYFLGKALHWRAETWDRLNAYNRTEQAADFERYLDARDSRNRFYWFLGTTVFVAMWDAYADAHLLSFERTRDKGDEFWGGETAGIDTEMWRVTLTLRF